MKVFIKGVDELVMDKIIECIGSKTIAECAIQEDDTFDLELNPELTKVQVDSDYINIVRTDTQLYVTIKSTLFKEVTIC